VERPQVHVVLEWKIPPGQARPITEALQAVMLATRRERGCAGCSLATQVSDLVTVRYEEDWETEDGLRHHLRSDRFRALATLVESATETPRIEFVLPQGARGLDYAEQVRASATTGTPPASANPNSRAGPLPGGSPTGGRRRGRERRRRPGTRPMGGRR
jgi:quinol monooxygenase YgiN